MKVSYENCISINVEKNVMHIFSDISDYGNFMTYSPPKLYLMKSYKY